MLKYTCAVFDLDGTILDTLDDLTAAVNHAMDMTNHSRHNRETVRGMVGNGVKKLIERALGEAASPEKTEYALSEFRSYYSSHLNVYTKPYDGIPEVLKALKEAGVILCVCSNKYDSAVQTLMDIHFPGLFDACTGEREGIPKKPDPSGTLSVMRAVRANADHTCYIGDSHVDVQTARNASLPCISVSWGFSDRKVLEALDPEKICDTADELLHSILGSAGI